MAQQLFHSVLKKCSISRESHVLASWNDGGARTINSSSQLNSTTKTNHLFAPVIIPTLSSFSFHTQATTSDQIAVIYGQKTNRTIIPSLITVFTNSQFTSVIKLIYGFVSEEKVQKFRKHQYFSFGNRGEVHRRLHLHLTRLKVIFLF